MPIYHARNIPDQVSRSALDPELAEWLKAAPRLGTHEPVSAQRAAHDRLIPDSLPPIGRVEHLALSGPHGTIPVRCLHPSRPGPAEGGALIYLHGGGFAVGSLDQFEAPIRILSEQSGAQVYLVDYRLAPEYRFPVQLDECEFVVRWLFEHARQRGLAADRIALGGDSAGGNLTCVLTLKLRDECGPRLAFQMPLYPETALPFETRAAVENRTGYYVESIGVLFYVWNHLTPDVDFSQPYVTPLKAASHADLPPALLVTCGFDPLRDVGHAYARKLAAAGNVLTYIHHEDLTHGFIQFFPHSRRCLEATQELARHLGEALRS